MRSIFFWLILFFISIKSSLYANEYTDDTVIQLLNVIEEKAFVSPNSELLKNFQQKAEVTDSDIQSFLTSFDKWGTWTSALKLQEQVNIVNVFDSSIGISLVKNKANTFICYPYYGQEAQKAGIAEGDILIAVDDYIVKDLSLEDISLLVRGKENTKVNIRVKRDENEYVYSLIRQKQEAKNIEITYENPIARIRIYSFEEDTAKKLKELLQKFTLDRNGDKEKDIEQIVIDVRGNTGGNFQSALRSASEFLQKGTLVSVFEKKQEQKEIVLNRFRTSKDGEYKDLKNIVIWQDSLTASAAEAFILALVDNARAVNIGETTFGKSYAQSVFKIGKNRLSLTTELLMSPKGLNWRNEGVVPLVFANPYSYEDLMAKTKNNVEKYSN